MSFRYSRWTLGEHDQKPFGSVVRSGNSTTVGVCSPASGRGVPQPRCGSTKKKQQKQTINIRLSTPCRRILPTYVSQSGLLLVSIQNTVRRNLTFWPVFEISRENVNAVNISYHYKQLVRTNMEILRNICTRSILITGFNEMINKI